MRRFAFLLLAFTGLVLAAALPCSARCEKPRAKMETAFVNGSLKWAPTSDGRVLLEFFMPKTGTRYLTRTVDFLADTQGRHGLAQTADTRQRVFVSIYDTGTVSEALVGAWPDPSDYSSP